MGEPLLRVQLQYHTYRLQQKTLMELEFTTEPLLNPALTTCPLWGKGEPIWIHSQKER